MTCEPPLARPAQFVRVAWRDLQRSPALAVEIAKRDIRKQYRQALFGPGAVVLTPLAMIGIALGFHRTGILNPEIGMASYPLYVAVGVILWMTFVDALNAPIHGLLADQRLLAQTRAPLEAIVLGKLGPLFLNVLIRAGVFVLVCIGAGVSLPASALFAPIGVLSLVVLGTSIGLLIAPINVLYRDVSWMVSTGTILWFVFSPVYFTAPPAGVVGAIMRLNPLTPILSDTRSLILTGSAGNLLPSLGVTLGACLLLVVCWLYARVALWVTIEQGFE